MFILYNNLHKYANTEPPDKNLKTNAASVKYKYN